MGDDSFFLTDFPFRGKTLTTISTYILSVRAEGGFEDQVGAGGRMPVLAQRKPRKLVKRMIQQDVDRYNYADRMLSNEPLGVGKEPDVVGMYLRATDGMQHILHNQEENWRREGGF